MTTGFTRVWKATGYCRPNGLLVAKDDSRSVWLPVERPVAVDARVQVGLAANWAASETSLQDWADQARILSERVGLNPEMKVVLTFRTYGAKNGGLSTERAAAIAAVRAVAAAVEEPMNSARLTDAEESLGWVSGLAWGAAGLTDGKTYTVLGVDRYVWIYARPNTDPELKKNFGDIDLLLNAKGSLAARLDKAHKSKHDMVDNLLDLAQTSGLKPLACVGGGAADHPFAILLPRDHIVNSSAQHVSSRMRDHLGPEWTVGLAQSAVPSLA